MLAGGKMKKLVALLSTCTTVAMPSIAFAQANLIPSEWMSSDRLKMLLDSAAVETPKLLTYLIFLGLGWLIGKRLTVLWSREQKENEEDLVAARDFHQLYGDFFALWKLWNYSIRDPGSQPPSGTSRWELLDRACRTEGNLEAVFVSLAASQRSLTNDDIETLGRFRQRYQQLRESIRDNVPLKWDHSEHPDYVEFKALAPQVAAIIVRSGRVRKELLLKITSNVYEVPNHRPGAEQREAT
jgi:hypothetical protein